MGKPNHIRSRFLRTRSELKTCFAIAMAVCGLAVWPTASCMFTREEQMYFCLPTASQAMMSALCLRIVKAIFGSAPQKDLTTFATLLSLHSHAARVSDRKSVV